MPENMAGQRALTCQSNGLTDTDVLSIVPLILLFIEHTFKQSVPVTTFTYLVFATFNHSQVILIVSFKAALPPLGVQFHLLRI